MDSASSSRKRKETDGTHHNEVGEEPPVEIKVKLEPVDEICGDSTHPHPLPLLRTCVVCFSPIEPGVEAPVCMNQLAPASSSSSSAAPASSSSSSSSSAPVSSSTEVSMSVPPQVTLRGEHYHCFPCFKALPRKKCSVCGGRFFAIESRPQPQAPGPQPQAPGPQPQAPGPQPQAPGPQAVMDLTRAAPIEEKKKQPQPAQGPPDPILSALAILENKEPVGDPAIDTPVLRAVLHYEAHGCKLLQQRSPHFINSFFARLSAANQLGFAKYVLSRECLSMRAVVPPLAPDATFEHLFVRKMSLTLRVCTNPNVIKMLYRAFPRAFTLLFEDRVQVNDFACKFEFPDSRVMLLQYGLLMKVEPTTSPSFIARWFCALVALPDYHDAIAILDYQGLAPLLARLTYECFDDVRPDAASSVLKPTEPMVMAMAERFPWFIKLAWRYLRTHVIYRGAQYPPISRILYERFYDAAPDECKVVRYPPRPNQQPLGPLPESLKPWFACYFVDPVECKWYVAPLCNLKARVEIAPSTVSIREAKLVIVDKDTDEAAVKASLEAAEVKGETIHVDRLHVFYFQRAHADGSNFRLRGDMSLWSIPSAECDHDYHTGWRYWRFNRLKTIPGTKRLDVVPGTVYQVANGAYEHIIAKVNVAVF